MHSVLLSTLFLIFKKWALLSVLHFTFVSVCRQRLPVFAYRKIFGGPSNPAPLGLFLSLAILILTLYCMNIVRIVLSRIIV